MMTVLSLGHLPSWAGGRQESGLANVIYQLAKHESEESDVSVILAATDVFVPILKDERLTILGWTKSMLLGYCMIHPVRSIRNFRQLKILKRQYPVNEGKIGLFLKRLFFDRCIRKVHPEIVHLHGASAVWYLPLLPQKCKVALTFHGMTGMDSNIPQYKVLWKMEHDAYHSTKVNVMVFICTQLVEQFKNAYGHNTILNKVIFNAYDNKHFYLAKNEMAEQTDKKDSKNMVTRLCTVASMSDLKGQMRVLSGLRMILDQNKFQYRCIGADRDGLADKMKVIADKYCIDFNYLGMMSPEKIRKYMAEVDYMIMPSSSEGFGLTYLEAIACGVPVILPKDIPIAQEKDIINEKNSILLEDCSADSIAKVLSHIEDYHFSRRNVAETIAGLTWDRIAKQYIDVYRML